MKRLIEVTFKNGQKATYTTDVYRLLLTDDFVQDITDAKTGEVLYVNE